MQAWFERLGAYVGADVWVVQVLTIAIGTLVVNGIAELLVRRAAAIAKRTSTVWDDALVSCAGKPMLVTIWLIGLGWIAHVLQKQAPDMAFLEEVLRVRDIGIVLCIAWFLLRFIGRVSVNIVKARQERGVDVDPTTVDALGKLARLVTFIVAVVVIAQTVGFQITGLLALGGVGGIAVGFAAKDMLANFFGGLAIYLDRPFVVGEWIRSPDKSIEGTVEYISWRHTRVRAFNKNPIYVPNSVFLNIVVENPSRMSNRRIKETIGVRYDDFHVLQPIVDDIRKMLQAHEDIDTNQTLIVNFLQFGPSSLDIMIYTFTRTTVWTEYHHVKQDVLLKIGEIIESHGAEIAFPTQTLHMVRDDDAAPMASNAPQMQPHVPSVEATALQAGGRSILQAPPPARPS